MKIKNDLSSTDNDFENKNRNIISLKLFNINREIEKILYRTEEDEIEEEYINRKNKMIKNLRINNSYIINNIINCFLKCYICKNNDINKIENIYSCSNCEDIICDNDCKDDRCYVLLEERLNKAIENNDENEMVWLQLKIYHNNY